MIAGRLVVGGRTAARWRDSQHGWGGGNMRAYADRQSSNQAITTVGGAARPGPRGRTTGGSGHWGTAVAARWRVEGGLVGAMHGNMRARAECAGRLGAQEGDAGQPAGGRTWRNAEAHRRGFMALLVGPVPWCSAKDHHGAGDELFCVRTGRRAAVEASCRARAQR